MPGRSEAFRDEFVADPKATIEKYSGQKLPAEAKILAHAEDDTTIHFVIPPKPSNADDLSDEDLEKVAGGIDIISTVILLTTVFAVSAGVGAGAAVTRREGW